MVNLKSEIAPETVKNEDLITHDFEASNSPFIMSDRGESRLMTQDFNENT